MTTISLRELHESTARWVREPPVSAALVITDRGKPIARLGTVASKAV